MCRTRWQNRAINLRFSDFFFIYKNAEEMDVTMKDQANKTSGSQTPSHHIPEDRQKTPSHNIPKDRKKDRSAVYTKF